MIYTANYLIEQRKKKWIETQDIEEDKKLRTAIANEIIKNKCLRNEIIQNPEKLIELVFVVVDKNQKTIPFFLNEVQKDFINVLNQAIDDFNNDKISEISILILKGRQQGFTTVVTAYQLAYSILHHNFQGYTLADNIANAETIFQNKAKFIYSQLPEVLKPTEKFNNKKQFLFDKLNSSWSVETATKEVGRSRTVNFFHGSECAFWKDGIATIQAALGEAFTKNCIKIYESTANGYNDYQTMWDNGANINCFYEWWRTPEYYLEFPSKDVKKEFELNIKNKDGWIWERLNWLYCDKKLNLKQLYWYFKKYEGYIDKDKIKQEYPCSPEEAFLLSGANAFDTECILKRLQNISKPIKIGYFKYDYDGLKISNIRWVNDRNGYIKIYENPRSTKYYAIGGDTAGDGSDFFTGHVIDAETGNQVAVLKKQFDEDEYTKQMYCLGVYYSHKKIFERSSYNIEALMAIETNYSTYPVMELMRLGYGNQYVREKIDEYSGKKEKRFGFKTTSLTRPYILARLVEIVREHCNQLNDEDTLRELLTIIKNEKSRIEAPQGKHDDQMMGLAIAYEARNQVFITKEPIILENETVFKPKTKYEYSSDYGEEINII